MKTIRVTRQQIIGDGAFATVYRISPRRVVKVFESRIKLGMKLAKDEIQGSKKYKYGLPVLRMVKVIRSYRGKESEFIGVIKKYIPYRVTNTEINKLYKNRVQNLPWDAHSLNFGKDYNGKIYMIDTATSECCNIHYRYI